MQTLSVPRERHSAGPDSTPEPTDNNHVPSGYCYQEHLVPLQQLEALAEVPGAWRTHGDDAEFAIPCSFQPGWVLIRYRIISEMPGRVQVFADNGEEGRELLDEGWIARDNSREKYVYFSKPVQQLSLKPIDRATTIRIMQFEVRSVPLPIAFYQAVKGKLRLLSKYHCTWPAMRRGAWLLLRGKVQTFVNNIWKGLTGEIIAVDEEYNLDETYAQWRQQRMLTEKDRDRLRREAARIENPPLFSVVMPVYNTDENYLRDAIESVRWQIYPHWELCIADDASDAEHVRPILEEYASLDPRIKVVHRPTRGNISAASNSALELATGDYVALVDHDDMIAEEALLRVAQKISDDPDVDMVYTDEDKLELDGRHVDPFFKPDWSPEYFQTCMYTCHLGVYRTSLVRELGGFRGEYDHAQDYDLALRIVARTQRVAHVPELLYHWRKAPESTATGKNVKPQAYGAAQRALTNHLSEIGSDGYVEPSHLPGVFRTRHAIQGTPLVSIVIPTAGRKVLLPTRTTTYLEMCLESIHALSTYPNYEIVVIHNDDLPDELMRKLEEWKVRLVAYREPFNLSRKINLGVEHARGSQVLLLNDDIEVISPDWMESMLEFSQQPGIGAVGVKLLFPTGRLQHTGVCILKGDPVHIYYDYPGDFLGYSMINAVVRNYSAVTGACMMTRKDLYQQLGGFAEEFYLNYNDVDFCLKVWEHGLRVVCTPHAQLYHHESVSKEPLKQAERKLFRKHWAKRWPVDPYYNQHFAVDQADFRLQQRR